MAVEISQIVSIALQKCKFTVHDVHDKEDYEVLIFLTNNTYLRVVFGKGYKNSCMAASAFKNHLLEEMRTTDRRPRSEFEIEVMKNNCVR